VLGALMVVFGVVVAVSLHRAEPILRAVIVEELENHFHARVELESFHVSLVKGLWAEGKGLRIWPPAVAAGATVPGVNGAAGANLTPPLIRVDEFRFHAPLHYDPGKPIRLSVVQIRGLNIDIPPKTQSTPASNSTSGGSTETKEIGAALLHFQIDAIECKDAHLKIESSKPNKLPLVFAIAEIKLRGVNAGGPMHFDAKVTIPRPTGVVTTSGKVGPWEIGDPGETPVAGDYKFGHADLGVFAGVAGILESKGDYQGALRDMEVTGTTETPDFRLTHFGTPVPLHTHFSATVDGTNGDTYLHPVDAVLGRSHFVAEGKVVRSQAETLANGSVRPAGREIELSVNVDRGRIEDFLRLASKSGTPLLSGDLTLKTQLEVPPGKEPVHQRMKLSEGSFTLKNAQFTSEKFQDYVTQLSLRGQGDLKDTKQAKQNGGNDVRATMQSDFEMAAGAIDLPDLRFSVPGADIDLAGKYGLEGSTLDFAGKARMQATISKMVGGWKGMLLEPADRLFKKDGAGTEVPIHVAGTREDPKFEIDIAGMKYTHAASPADKK
jgi:hypothetical protein